MSGPPVKLGLDARAAELKAKLMRSRGQSQNSACAGSSPSLHSPAKEESVSPGTMVGKSSPIPTLGSTSVGHSATASIPASADDIAALISSISADAEENSGTENTGGLDGDHKNTVMRVTKTTTNANGSPRLLLTVSTTVPTKTSNLGQSRQQSTKASTVQFSQQGLKVKAAPNELEEGEVLPAAHIKVNHDFPKLVAQKTGTKTETETETAVVKQERKVALNGVDHKPSEKEFPSNHQEASGNHTDTKPEKPIAARSPVESGNQLRSTVREPVGTTVEPTNTNSHSSANGNRTNGPAPDTSPVSSDAAFTRLLNQVPDLRDFLEMTDYYNTEARARKLDRFRRAKALAAEKLRIEEEERKLREEEELEMALPRSAPIIAHASSTSSHGNYHSYAVPSTQSSASNTLPTPITPSSGSAAAAIPLVKEEPQNRNHDNNSSIRNSSGSGSGTASKNPAKRTHDDNEDDTSLKKEAKVPRIEAPLASRRRTDNDSAHTINRRDDKGGDPNSHKNDDRHRPSYDDSFQDSSSHRRHESPLRGPARFKEKDGFERKYDSYKGGPSNGENRHRELEGPTQYPVPVDLGRKGDSRFFIVKSFNAENVKRCMKDGLWTTQLQNSQLFADAFAKCRNVILFFSVNKSRAFQGYARMITPPSPSVPRPSFLKDIHFDASDPFRVSWLSKTAVHFFRIGHIKNACNDFAPVLVGKDGQEIDGEAGAELVREMEKFAEAWQSGEPFPAAPRSDGDGGRDRDIRDRDIRDRDIRDREMRDWDSREEEKDWERMRERAQREDERLRALQREQDEEEEFLEYRDRYSWRNKHRRGSGGSGFYGRECR